MSTTRMGARVMTQQNEEHFETIDQNKAEQYERQKIKFLEDRIKVLEKSIESHAKILARFQMTEDKDNNEMPEWVTTTGKMRNV